jgi:hypothetical protein
VFFTASDRRRLFVVGALSLVLLPVFWWVSRGDDSVDSPAVAVAGPQGGISLTAPPASTAQSATDSLPEPVILNGPVAAAPGGSARIAYPSSESARLSGNASFSNFQGGPSYVCYAPEAPYGLVLRVTNLNNGRTTSCTNVVTPSIPPGTRIVLHTQVFLALSDLVNAPIPVAVSW